MDITPFIRELLFGHDCVIIPGFGGFIGNYTPAHIDKVSGLFYPPVKQISFNRNLNHNDGLLTGKVSEALKLNYADARNIVELFAEEIRSKLGKGDKVVFEKIGSFVNNSEGNVQFEPDRDSNYSLNSYGLEPFEVTPLERFDVRKRIVPFEPQTARRSDFRKYLWRAAVIIPLLGAMVAVPLTTNLFKSKVQTSSLNPLASVEFENNSENIDKTNKQEASELSTTPGINNTGAPVNVPVINGTTSPDRDIYCVIAGSFRSQVYAEALIKKLTDEGYTPELQVSPKGFYRVSVLKCSDPQTALQKKDSIGRSYSGTWISKIR
jgi:hypothetical protein